MIQTATSIKIHVTNPMTPKISTRERAPENPENRLESGLLELFPPLFPFPLPFPFPFDEVIVTLTEFDWVWFVPESLTVAWTVKVPVDDGLHENVSWFCPPHPAGSPE